MAGTWQDSEAGKKLLNEVVQGTFWANPRLFYLRFGTIGRTWDAETAAEVRAWLVLQLDQVAEASVRQTVLKTLFTTSDGGELVVLYRLLPQLRFEEWLVGQAAEGLRSNMAPVFQAVALDNPFPAAHFSEGAFNQMVLKAAFTGASLDRIVGLQQRFNPALKQMLQNYVAERRAAKRDVAADIQRWAEFSV